MDTVQSVALAAGLAWGSGLRLYAVLFAAGLLGRLGYLDLPQALQVLQHPWVLGAAGVMLAIEFLADKIPLVDSLWDAAHSFIRIPAGAVLAAAALGEHDPALAVVAAILGAHFLRGGMSRPEDTAALGASAGNLETVALALFRDYLLPFEVVSVLLLVALVGAIVLARPRA